MKKMRGLLPRIQNVIIQRYNFSSSGIPVSVAVGRGSGWGFVMSAMRTPPRSFNIGDAVLEELQEGF
jgi:hypothetical protein